MRVSTRNENGDDYQDQGGVEDWGRASILVHAYQGNRRRDRFGGGEAMVPICLPRRYIRSITPSRKINNAAYAYSGMFASLQ